MLKSLHFGSIIYLALLIVLSSEGFSKKVWAETEDKSRIGLPSRRIGGGTRRDSCIASRDSLVALVPESMGKTVSAFPTFFFYLPQMERSRTVEFVLRGPEDKFVYDTSFSASGDAGIVSLSLPTDVEPLKIDDDYRWYLSVICNPQNRAQDIVVEGLVRRVNLQPAASERLEDLEPLEQANFYQRANIWYEALTTVAQSESFHTRDRTMIAKWLELLHSVGLDTIAQEPVVAIDRGSTLHKQEAAPSFLDSSTYELGRTLQYTEIEVVQ